MEVFLAMYLHVHVYMRMQVVTSPVHMPSVTAKRWGVGFFIFNSAIEISAIAKALLSCKWVNHNSHMDVCALCTRSSPHYLVWPGN